MKYINLNQIWFWIIIIKIIFVENINNRFRLNDKDPTVNDFLRNNVFKGIPISQAEINRYVPMVNYLTKFEE